MPFQVEKTSWTSVGALGEAKLYGWVVDAHFSGWVDLTTLKCERAPEGGGPLSSALEEWLASLPGLQQQRMRPLLDHPRRLRGGVYEEFVESEALHGADGTSESATLVLPRGHAMCHASGLRHAGRRITRGERWVLVVFVLATEVPHAPRRLARAAPCRANRRRSPGAASRAGGARCDTPVAPASCSFDRTAVAVPLF